MEKRKTDDEGKRSNLKPRAVVGETTDTVQGEVDDLLADGVVPARVVVRGVLLARDHLRRMEQVLVHAGAHLICKIIQTT